MNFILLGSSYLIPFFRASSLELLMPAGLPFTSSSAVNKQLISAKAHFPASVCNFAACNFSLFTGMPEINVWFYQNTIYVDV